MSKTMVFSAIIIFLIVSWLTSFIKTLDNDVDVNYGFQEKALDDGATSNTILDNQGNEVLVLTKLSLQEKKNLWANSLLKNDMLAQFPRFSEMRDFVKNHIEDDGNFKKKLLEHIDNVEIQYIGGTLTGQSAKASLSTF